MDKNIKLLFYLSSSFIIFKIIAIYYTELGFHGDEAQYWVWSKNLAGGYFSKPPLLPWLIKSITSIFGDSFFILKSIPIFLYCIISYLIFILTRNYFC